MTEHISRRVTGATFELAEGIVWDDRRHEVVWVEIHGGDVHVATWDADALITRRVVGLGPTIGAVALAGDGGYVVAGARGLVTISPDGAISRGPDLVGDRRNVRFNDGAVDPQGRFLAGTMSLSDPTGVEVLLRVSADGTVETLRTGLSLSNGLAWSLDGGTVYHVDTIYHSLSSHSYGPGDFDTDEPWVDLNWAFAADPDGMIIDSEGMFWVAQWGAGCVQRFSPDGAVIDVVTVDAPQVSCMAFVGPDLDTLMITTAFEGMTAPTDGSGALFAADVGATGRLEPRWAGSTTSPPWT